MKRLTVLYDAACGFCVTCRWWLAMQPSYLGLEFLPAGSPEAARRFPGLAEAFPGEELTVIDEEGGVYRAPESFIICLYALEEYRELSFRLSNPLILPLARKAFELVSAN